MSRPRKCRKVCCLPRCNLFVPEHEPRENMKIVILAVDEYETIRLIDYQGFSQEECSKYMNVSRTTVQQIYTSARRKIAKALVTGSALHIQGGDYQLCSEEERRQCNHEGCPKRRCYWDIKEENKEE